MLFFKFPALLLQQNDQILTTHHHLLLPDTKTTFAFQFAVYFFRIDMPRLSTEERNRAIGMLQVGLSRRRVAAVFNADHRTIGRLRERLDVTGTFMG